MGPIGLWEIDSSVNFRLSSVTVYRLPGTERLLINVNRNSINSNQKTVNGNRDPVTCTQVKKDFYG